MAAVGLWGAVPQSEAVVQDATHTLAKLDSKLITPSSDETLAGGGSDFDQERADQEVADLARQLTHHSIKNSDGYYSNPFEGSDDPALDPRSGKFNAEAWVRTLMG